MSENIKNILPVEFVVIRFHFSLTLCITIRIFFKVVFLSANLFYQLFSSFSTKTVIHLKKIQIFLSSSRKGIKSSSKKSSENIFWRFVTIIFLIKVNTVKIYIIRQKKKKKENLSVRMNYDQITMKKLFIYWHSNMSNQEFYQAYEYSDCLL